MYMEPLPKATHVDLRSRHRLVFWFSLFECDLSLQKYLHAKCHYVWISSPLRVQGLIQSNERGTWPRFQQLRVIWPPPVRIDLFKRSDTATSTLQMWSGNIRFNNMFLYTETQHHVDLLVSCYLSLGNACLRWGISQCPCGIPKVRPCVAREGRGWEQ